jgi:peptide deformylase
MAILKVARMGHPILAAISEPVEDPTAPEIGQLIADMAETMMDAPGVGLAAPQVHVAKRIVVFQIPESRDAESGGVPVTALINPVIEPLGDDMADGVEGCLSLPDMIGGKVPRYTRIRYTGIGPDGETIEREAEGYHARVVQHECDHLDGILYPMRMRDLSTFGFVEEMMKGVEGADDNDEDGGADGDGEEEAADG